LDIQFALIRLHLALILLHFCCLLFIFGIHRHDSYFPLIRKKYFTYNNDILRNASKLFFSYHNFKRACCLWVACYTGLTYAVIFLLIAPLDMPVQLIFTLVVSSDILVISVTVLAISSVLLLLLFDIACHVTRNKGVINRLVRYRNKRQEYGKCKYAVLD